MNKKAQELNYMAVLMAVIGAVIGFIVVKQMDVGIFWKAASVAVSGIAGYVIASAMSSG